jgi:methyl-accepting chemotaxis protein
MRALFGPAFRVLARLSFFASFFLVASLFLLPAMTALHAGALLGDWLQPVVYALFGLAVYWMAALRAFMTMGVDRLVGLLDRIAGGELVADVGHRNALTGRHDSVRMWTSVMEMNQSLAGIVQQVRASAESIATGSRAIAEGNLQLSERTQEQAASLEQTAAGVEQLAQGARDNALGCQQATDLAGASRQVALAASARMDDVAATMRDIDENARRVADILGSVEGIAFQTNILALNAAVEAARAGEHGRGFAVVASEVRILAQRSAEAAKEIKQLIARSVESVESGRRLVDAAASTMGEVVTGAERVTQVLQTISRASAEQSTGVQEINRAITSLDDMTQQNASLVEEAAGSAASFQQEAARLLRVVDRFKADRGEDRGRIVELVQRAVQHFKRHGQDQACRDFNDRRGRFVRGEDYVFGFDLQGTRIAFAPDPSLVGRNYLDATDADGCHFVREMLDATARKGAGWVEYRYLNPRSGQVEPKSVYVERVGDVVLGCGIYRSDAQRSPAQDPHGLPVPPAPQLAAGASW